jgi:hypothetical protein
MERTVVFELQALKELGIVEWIRGWGNEHGTVSSRYTLNLARMNKLGEDESAAVHDESAAVHDEGAAVTLSKCTPCTLTSKEPPILELPSIEPSAHSPRVKEKGKFETKTVSHLQREVSAARAPSYESAADAPSSRSPVLDALAYEHRSWGARRDIGRALEH